MVIDTASSPFSLTETGTATSTVDGFLLCAPLAAFTHGRRILLALLLEQSQKGGKPYFRARTRMPAFVRTPALPEAIRVGALAAQLRRPLCRSAMSGLTSILLKNSDFRGNHNSEDR